MQTPNATYTRPRPFARPHASWEEKMHFIRKASLTVIACAMLLVVGTALAQAEDRFIDNGDGTISDTQTGLMWEKKTANPGLPDRSNVHDVKNRYVWSDLGAAPNGSAFTKFLYGFNGGTSPDGTSTSGCFAGHCDWRLPLIEELAGIVDKTQGRCGGGRSGACIDPILGPRWHPPTGRPLLSPDFRAARGAQTSASGLLWTAAIKN